MVPEPTRGSWRFIYNIPNSYQEKRLHGFWVVLYIEALAKGGWGPEIHPRQAGTLAQGCVCHLTFSVVDRGRDEMRIEDKRPGKDRLND